MPAQPQSPEGGTSPSRTGSGSIVTGPHNIYVQLLGEIIGVAILAIVADMNDGMGKVAVALIGGWFFVFLILHAPVLQSLFSKVGNG